MCNIYKLFFISALTVFLAFGTASAKVSKEEAAKLGNELTPMGAIKAGSADGVIPEWTGGLSTPPAGYVEGKVEPDPFAADKILFTITAKNFKEHADKLTPGQIAMFEAYPDTFKMNIYPTRRSAAFPQYMYDAARYNAENAEINTVNYDLTGFKTAIPFPIPQTGLEAIYNHLVAYIPAHIHWVSNQAVTTRSGDYSIVRMDETVYCPNTVEGAMPDPQKHLLFKQETLAPPRIAGSVLVVHAANNKVTHSQQAWLYNPGQRRVRRAPSVEYDGPGTAADGLRTTDDYLIYNGAPDRYDWKLVGRKVVYTPYNCYKIADKKLKNSDIVMPGHINQDYVRYEAHRMWVVEGVLKGNMRHIYKKRVFYLDEDSWVALMAEAYDNRDQLWRVIMGHETQVYNVPYFNVFGMNAFYDLQARRYLVQNMLNEEGFVDYKDVSQETDFSPSALRRAGRR